VSGSPIPPRERTFLGSASDAAKTIVAVHALRGVAADRTRSTEARLGHATLLPLEHAPKPVPARLLARARRWWQTDGRGRQGLRS
jgi:hypothetical protein